MQGLVCCGLSCNEAGGCRGVRGGGCNLESCLLYYPTVLSLGHHTRTRTPTNTPAYVKKSERVERKGRERTNLNVLSTEPGREGGRERERGRGSNQPPGPNHVRLFFLFTEALLPAPHLDTLSCQNYFISISAFTTSEGGMQGNDVQGTD